MFCIRVISPNFIIEIRNIRRGGGISYRILQKAGFKKFPEIFRVEKLIAI
jgi:hypothetical protein